MHIGNLGRSAGRFVTEPLEQLREALESLGQRLRESLAHLVGAHVGQAVRDSLGAALTQEEPEHIAARYDHYERYQQDPDDIEEERFWGRPAPRPQLPPPEAKPPGRWFRWKALLSGGVQIASVWLQQRMPRRSLRWLVCLGAVAGLTTLATGPLVGGLVTTAVTTYLLTRPPSSGSISVNHREWPPRC
jgi:hypothetical protein